MNIRATLNEIYLDYKNNYLTIERFAEANLLDREDAAKLIAIAWKVNIEGVDFQHDLTAMVF